MGRGDEGCGGRPELVDDRLCEDRRCDLTRYDVEGGGASCSKRGSMRLFADCSDSLSMSKTTSASVHMSAHGAARDAVPCSPSSTSCGAGRPAKNSRCGRQREANEWRYVQWSGYARDGNGAGSTVLERGERSAHANKCVANHTQSLGEGWCVEHAGRTRRGRVPWLFWAGQGACLGHGREGCFESIGWLTRGRR